MVTKLDRMHQNVFNLGSLISQAVNEPLFLSLTEGEGPKGHFVGKRNSDWLGKHGREYLKTKCINLDNRMLQEGSRIGTTPPFRPALENGFSRQTVIRTKSSITALCGWDNEIMTLFLTLILHYARTEEVRFREIEYHYADAKEREGRFLFSQHTNGNGRDISQGFYQRGIVEVKTPFTPSGKYEEKHFRHTQSPLDGLDLDFVTPSPEKFITFLANYAGQRWDYFNGNDLYQTGFLCGGDYRINICARKDWIPT